MCFIIDYALTKFWYFTHRASTTASPPRFGGFVGEFDVGVQECDDCESPLLTIHGNGFTNGHGIEVGQAGRGGKTGFTTATPPPPAPVTTAIPVYSTTPSYDAGFDVAGYQRPVKPGYGVGGIAVSNPGEHGVRPGHAGISTTQAPTTTAVPTGLAPVTPAPAPAYGAAPGSDSTAQA